MISVSYTSAEVKNAWKQRNYKRYEVNFRLDTDKDIIDYIGIEVELSWPTLL